VRNDTLLLQELDIVTGKVDNTFFEVFILTLVPQNKSKCLVFEIARCRRSADDSGVDMRTGNREPLIAKYTRSQMA
jgi:hypothetical protein